MRFIICFTVMRHVHVTSKFASTDSCAYTLQCRVTSPSPGPASASGRPLSISTLGCSSMSDVGLSVYAILQTLQTKVAQRRWLQRKHSMKYMHVTPDAMLPSLHSQHERQRTLLHMLEAERPMRCDISLQQHKADHRDLRGCSLPQCSYSGTRSSLVRRRGQAGQ